MKASNPKVMVEAYRLLVARLNELGDDWNYPIHLGVTEAGDGEDGRIKSAIGIGSLLSDGVGDTIRVSLTEDAIHEIPVGKALVANIDRSACTHELWEKDTLQRGTLSYDPFSYSRRNSKELEVNGHKLGGTNTVRVFTSQEKWDAVAHKIENMGDFKPEVAVIHAFRLLACKIDAYHPILLKDTFTPNTDPDSDFQENLLTAARNLGTLLCDGIGDAVMVQSEQAPGQSLRLAYNILQAAGTRIFKTDYVACPSCGRTLFNLQETTQKIRAATGHLKGVRIAIMGCIVNGPGEMADADFGYVGGAPNKINLYINKTPVKFNIPEAEAVDRLIELIKENDRWIDPPATVATV